jgi:hypothetical protein
MTPDHRGAFNIDIWLDIDSAHRQGGMIKASDGCDVSPQDADVIGNGRFTGKGTAQTSGRLLGQLIACCHGVAGKQRGSQYRQSEDGFHRSPLIVFLFLVKWQDFIWSDLFGNRFA